MSALASSASQATTGVRKHNRQRRPGVSGPEHDRDIFRRPAMVLKFQDHSIEKSPPLWGNANEGGKASDWSRIQNTAF